MSAELEAVIFDVDGVLCRYRRDLRLEMMSRMSGVPAERIEEVIFNQGFDEDGDRGRYSAEEYHRLFCERIGAPLTVDQWLDARAASVEPDPEVLDMARRLKGRVMLATLTNNGPLLKEHFARVFPEAAEIFGEHAHFSCEFQTCKPDPLVFRRLVERLEVAAGASLFIDDSPSYVDGATEAGLRAHRFESAEGLRRVLGAHGLPV